MIDQERFLMAGMSMAVSDIACMVGHGCVDLND
jgi:hypothetical protein